MASLWKRKTSPYFTCCYDSADGQRLKKSTKQTHRTKAMEVCLGIERAEKIAKDRAMTEATAKRIIGEILERTTGQGLQNHRAGPWLDEWLEGKRQSRTGGTLAVYRRIVKEFKASLGARVDIALAAVTPRDILHYRAGLLAEGKSANAANQSLTCIGVAFNAAFRLGLIPSNPCAAVESLAQESLSRDTFTPAQVADLVKAEKAKGDWRRAIVFAYYTGARLGDIVAMRWNMIDLGAQTITFQPKKTKKTIRRVVIPIHPDLEAVLLEAPGIGTAPVFPKLHGQRTGGGSGLSTQFSDIMKEAGIKGTMSRHTEEGRKHYSLSFHSLRHSFNSALANVGVSQELRMKLTGHTKAATNTGYTHHELAVLRAAVVKMPGIG